MAQAAWKALHSLNPVPDNHALKGFPLQRHSMPRRIWRGLPWGGLGWGSTKDLVLSELRLWAAADWRRKLSPLLRMLLWLTDRFVWPLAALSRTLAFAGNQGLKPAETLRLYGDCLMSGGQPMEAHVWRGLYGSRHPLPARSAALLLTRLGDPAGHALLADKLATAEQLAMAGIKFPVLHSLYRRGATLAPALPFAGNAGLFLKPRHGQGGRNAFALTQQGETWHLDGRPITATALCERLQRLSRQDDLLLQEKLIADPDLAELVADDRAPVLRLATARLPGEAPFLQSALLTLAVPGRNPRHFLDGALHAPIDMADGRLAAGLSLARPGDRLAQLGWNGAILAGRPVPWFDEASAMALRAMREIPALPLVHWDIIPTGTGPVMLEGNSAGNWILANLAGAYGLDTCPLPPLLSRWMSVSFSPEADPGDSPFR
ncbi:MAG: hypothetical protein KKB63_01850 [Alphaproteobacteria bacterium]|nr:hypothetical protein [Alphaproteobacteria bacterium]